VPGGFKRLLSALDESLIGHGKGISDLATNGGGSTQGRRTVAVALSQEGAADAPRVVATGRGAVAERILEIAFASGVKVRQDADLAQLLSAVDVDSLIPLEAFGAVAEILTYVYKANGRLTEGGSELPQ
jgi:flagellar biosynthesis protein